MKEELLFCPLGGSGEIGMNMNLFAYGKPDNQKWIIVDIGVTFADDTIPGIDLIYPDPGFIVDKKDDLVGLILTHAHEDHIGAIAHIWPKLLCNIYATPFTSVLIQEKFKEKKINIGNKLKIVQLNGKINQRCEEKKGTTNYNKYKAWCERLESPMMPALERVESPMMSAFGKRRKIFRSKSGKHYVIRVSKKTGKRYRSYI